MRFGCLGDGWGSLSVSPRIMLESSIVGYALNDTSWRILPRCSLGQERTCRAGYEVVKVKRHSLLRAKIVEDRLNDQTLFFG